MYKVSDVAQIVVDKLRNRNDLNFYDEQLDANIPSWIYQTVLDLSQNFPFEDLVIKGPYVNFQQGIAEYPIDYFEQRETSPFTMIRSFFRFFSADNPPSQPMASGPQSQTGGWLKSRATTTVEPMSVIPGIPSVYCQNGKFFLFGPCPNQNYTVFMRYQQEHPFNLKDLPAEVIRMPNDWKEVIAYGAALRGAEHVGMTELADKYYMRLHGDPKRPADIGLLAQKRSQLARNMDVNERQLQPMITRYTG